MLMPNFFAKVRKFSQFLLTLLPPPLPLDLISYFSDGGNWFEFEWVILRAELQTQFYLGKSKKPKAQTSHDLPEKMHDFSMRSTETFLLRKFLINYSTRFFTGGRGVKRNRLGRNFGASTSV